MSDDPRMAMTLRDVEKYLVIARHHALTIWKFPILYHGWRIEEICEPTFYPGAQPCKPSENKAA